MAAKETMKKVGDGKSIDIWKDSCIPFSENGMIKRPRPLNCQLKTLNQLMINRCWNKTLIEKTFLTEDAKKILRIPISVVGKKDIMI